MILLPFAIIAIKALFFIMEIEAWTISNLDAQKKAPKFENNQNNSIQENSMSNTIGKQFITSLNASVSILSQRYNKHLKRKKYINSIGQSMELTDNHSNSMSSMQFLNENLKFVKENNFDPHRKNIIIIKLKNNS